MSRNVRKCAYVIYGCPPKFKNIPALNGHMRLHGGYYKKDADGRRLVGMANTSPLKTVGLSSTAQQSPTPTTSATAHSVRIFINYFIKST